tara:strand:+ start:3420 stop:4088 length:669 start_codon:yes stop_codon:yes gene_type:complete
MEEITNYQQFANDDSVEALSDDEVTTGSPITDRDQYDAPVPGQSLTDEQGKWGWERPPRFANPEEAFDYVLTQIERTEEGKEEYRKFMLAGIPIESVVNTICFGGFTEGFWTADMCELLKFPLTLYFINMAQEEEIPAKMFNESSVRQKTENTGMDMETLFKLMKENNPDLHEKVGRGLENQKEVERFNESVVTQDNSSRILNDIRDRSQNTEDSFMTAEEV